MLNRVWISGALIMAALMLSYEGAGQKFQEPTKEELQMTSDPKAPGAEAVYLYRQEETDNNSHYVGEYARIKVLTEKGTEWATVEVPILGIIQTCVLLSVINIFIFILISNSRPCFIQKM